jgi:hypothetical protein
MTLPSFWYEFLVLSLYLLAVFTIAPIIYLTRAMIIGSIKLTFFAWAVKQTMQEELTKDVSNEDNLTQYNGIRLRKGD